MSLPHVDDNTALPALFDRLWQRAPDDLHLDTVTACGFDASEYWNINGLLQHLNFLLANYAGEPQIVSAFWRERYHQRDDRRKALGWMLKKQYPFIYSRAANPLDPTMVEVVEAIKVTRYIDERQRPDTDKIAATFLAVHKLADLNVPADYFGIWPDSYIITGVLPPDNEPLSPLRALGKIKPVWWIVLVLVIALMIARSS